MVFNTLNGKAPNGAVILFDGTSFDSWTNMKGSAAEWELEDEAMRVVPRKGGICSKELFQDHFLHLEFRLSHMPDAVGQAKANSGVYLQGRYEIQVLDSYGWDIPGFGDCGAIYDQYAPLSNACKRAMEWQTYDIIFCAPHCEGTVIKEHSSMTVIHNSVIIHNNVELPGNTGASTDMMFHRPGHLRLQDHRDIVWYRNIWAIHLPKEGANEYEPRMRSRS